MTGFLRVDDPLPQSDLLALEYDGLLQRLTQGIWVSAGTITDPALRASALGPLPRPRLALSHRAAHWVWWGSGSGRAPALLEYTTLTRRRVRAGDGEWTVYEREVPPPDRVVVGELAVTSPERTLFDLVRAALGSPDPLASGRHAFARVPDPDRQAFLRWLTRVDRRPYTEQARALALRTIGTAPQTVTR